MVLTFNRKNLIEKIDIQPRKVAKILYQNASPSILERKIQSERFIENLDSVKENYLKLAEPEGLVKDIEVELLDKIFAESLPETSTIFKAISLFRVAAVFVATIGQNPETTIQTLARQGDLTRSLFLDAACSVLTDNLAEYIQKQWEKKIKKEISEPHRYYSNRYSPGYCNWDVRGQSALMGYMADLDLPVTLTKNGMMHPVKSISGILVLEEKQEGKTLSGACRFCPDKCKNLRFISS
ncbi:MAG: vitamin B12 dependent-methionine synthase activation domain-containing protein [Vulcanimicrobiota bacterium]